MSYLYSRNFFFILLFLLIATCLYAQKNITESNQIVFKKGFYVGVEMGIGSLQLSENNQTQSRKGSYILGFYGGYRLSRILRVGMEIDGYLIEASNYSNPEEGIGISNTHLQMQVFPFKTVPLFTNLQWGWSKYSNNHPHGRDAKGTSQKIGLGYEYNFEKHFALSLISNYSFGKFNDVNDVLVTIYNQHYDSWDITLCLTYR